MGVAIGGGLLLFLPNSIISLLRVDGFMEKFGFIVGPIFVVSIAILASNLLIETWKFIKEKYDMAILKRNRKRWLKGLEPYYKEIIEEMFNNPERTIKLPMNSGPVMQLRLYDMICPAGTPQLMGLDMKVAYFLQPWVVEEIRWCP